MMFWQWEQGIQDFMAIETWPVETRYRRCSCCGNNVQDMLFLWEQGTGDAVVAGTRHSRCCCCGNKAQQMLLLWEQGT